MWVFAGWCNTACSLVCLRFRVVVLFVGYFVFLVWIVVYGGRFSLGLDLVVSRWMVVFVF